MSESLELLAPAADKSVAKAAIDCGADAVYIGAPRFGARVKAGNSVSDIAETVRYAHFYGAKVYVTLNTVLSDAEWPEANRIAWQCHEAGVDAFIIQDMAWLTADNRPPAVWHASTQCDIRTPEKARMLAGAGVSRLILARELNLAEMGAIHAAVPDVELEAFVHGALCVSYSGQCYLSEYLFGRSGNRGACAQACRLAYDLVNASGKRLASGLHLLSLKDLALGAYMADMAAQGIRSFKIEGRLKDVCYVRNVTAYYRRVLDGLLAQGDAQGSVAGSAVASGADLALRPEAYRRASCGRVSLAFEPDLEKGFHRPYGTHFIEAANHGEKASLYTPKAMGEAVGRVLSGGGRRWLLQTAKPLRRGDGLCFFDAQRQLVGFGLNEVQAVEAARQGGRGKAAPRRPQQECVWSIVAAKDVPLFAGAEIFRNQDVAFEKRLRSERAAERRVRVRGGFSYEAGNACLWARDEEGLEVRLAWQADYAAAENPGRMRENLRKQMCKTGDLPFEWTDFETGTPPFIPIAELNARRRELLEALYGKRVSAHAVRPQVACIPAVVHSSALPPDENGRPQTELDYRANVANAWAEKFYRAQGVAKITRERRTGQWLMQCKYCIRYELRQCPRHFKNTDPDYQQDLYLIYKAHTFALRFDCARERMEVYAVQNGKEA